MNRRRRRLNILLFVLGAGVAGGGVTSSRADEAQIEGRVGELRGEILLYKSRLNPTGGV